jgi:hypothetical protein
MDAIFGAAQHLRKNVAMTTALIFLPIYIGLSAALTFVAADLLSPTYGNKEARPARNGCVPAPHGLSAPDLHS